MRDRGRRRNGFERHAGPRREKPHEPPQLLSPILRWAGGKQQLVSQLTAFLPRDVTNRVYREPFLGAGCLFFAVQPEKAVLSDANEHLIRCYEFVRDQAPLVARYLRRYAAMTSEKYYYEVRRIYNRLKFSAPQAARFIYLNKTCFNGIFRVNREGTFNVPYGWKNPPAIPSVEHLRRVSAVLKRATLRPEPFGQALALASTGDFVYLDPPYPPLNGVANFRHYTMDRFNPEDQKKLAATVRELDARGCLVMMSNADIELIRSLYKGFHITSLPVRRFVTCKAKKGMVTELIITNYP